MCIRDRNTALHRKIADHEETIEALQDRIQTMQADHRRELRDMQQKHSREITDKDTRHKQEISFLKTVIAKAALSFQEKPDGDRNWINAGYFVCEPEVFDYIPENDDTVIFERKPLELSLIHIFP